MGEFVARNMLGSFRKINKRKSCCILLVAYIVVLVMHGHTNIKFSNISSPLAARSSSCLTYACCRMCSFELLMMDGKTVRNMYSVLQE